MLLCVLCVPVGQGVGKHFDEVYTKMVEYAREHDIESTKRKPERFPSAIGEILQQVLGTDYDILNPQADEPIKIERGALTELFVAKCRGANQLVARFAFSRVLVRDVPLLVRGGVRGAHSIPLPRRGGHVRSQRQLRVVQGAHAGECRTVQNRVLSCLFRALD